MSIPRVLQHALTRILAAFFMLVLAGCGGGGGGTTAEADSNGTVLVSLTDADGDFIHYTVDVVSLRLVRANGSVVETVPAIGRLDFAAYTELAELFSAAAIPAGTYVAGEITLDYDNAQIEVEANGMPVAAAIRDRDGNPLTRETLRIRLPEDRPLVVTRARTALLSVDFDLDASHDVDTSTVPAIVTAAPFLIAELEPVAEKELRVRGPLQSVSEAESSYIVRVRPWHLAPGTDFGRVTVHTDADTEFEIDGVTYTGSAGLGALAALPIGTATVAQGTLTTAERRYDAAVVLAGSSVPGATLDAVQGSVVARSGDVLTVHGATVIRSTGAVVTRDRVTVTIGDDTSVRRRPGIALDKSAISVGSRVEILGTVTSGAGDPLALNATQGRVRLLVTHLAGQVNGTLPGQLDLDLRAIDRRPVGIYDFSGTGIAPASDADPSNYEVSSGTPLAGIEAGEPVRVFGFVQPFGAAPGDFDGITVVHALPALARIGVGWHPGGTAAPFSVANTDALVVDLDNDDIGLRHHLLLGHQLVDLYDLPAAPTIVPPAAGPGRYAILYRERVILFRDFAAWVTAVNRALGEGAAAYGFWADGAYDRDDNELAARVLGIHLSRVAAEDDEE